ARVSDSRAAGTLLAPSSLALRSAACASAMRSVGGGMLPPQAETNGSTITSEKIDLYITLFSIRQGIGGADAGRNGNPARRRSLCELSALSAPIAVSHSRSE